ncbi:MAG: caspase family protein, partial [Oleiphilaceae bacterium]|nr:caspase family protein [Oleiphilaceae bacterium]
GMTYLTQRRPIKTTGVDCEIRAGEYELNERANYENAKKIWLPMAENGDPKAQNYVGEIYEKGLGVNPDYGLAAQWYQKAADQGYKAAQINLGQLYERGQGVAYSMEQALAWYRKAASIEGKALKFVSYDYSDERIADMEKRLADSEAQAAIQASRIRFLAQRLDQSETREQRAMQQLVAQKQKLEDDRLALDAQKQALQEQQDAVQALRKELKQHLLAQEDTAQKAQQLETLRAQLAQSEQEMTKLNAQFSEQQRLLSERELALKQKDLKLAELAASKQQLQAELSETQEQLVAMVTTQPATAAGPEAQAAPIIEMIEPPLVATRSAESNVFVTRSAVDQRTIIGQVKSGHPLLEVMVNDQSVSFDDKGMFQHRVPLTRSITDVQVVAIDTMGQRADLSFKLKLDYAAEADFYAKQEAAQAKVKAIAVPDVDFGNYHALVIGNSQYQFLPKLNSTIADADAMENVLTERYGFKVTKLIDATRYDILSALNTLRGELTEDDNLLIYYAGHGELDQVNNRGHWLPIDAEETSTANWISNIAITDILNAMSVRKVLVVADSCYSGAMTRSTLARLDAGRSPEAWENWLKLVAEKRSRLSFSSGGLAPVLDGGGGQHSIFAKALLDALQANRTVIEGRQLHAQVAQAVSYAAQAAQFEQTPQYAPIRFAGHESGDFLFVPK